MCGIFAIIDCKKCNENDKNEAIKQSNIMKHRGPDSTGYYMNKNIILCHKRLSIMDINSGFQPIISSDKKIILIVNGEIYNYKYLKETITNYKFQTLSDSEIIIALYKTYGPHFMKKNLLKGMYSFILYDNEKDIIVVSRDHIGIIPLYEGYSNEKRYFSSEMKSLVNVCENINVYEPGQYTINNKSYNYYNPYWMNNIGINNLDYKLLKNTLINAVRSHMITDNLEYGLLLSGGLDSSLVASIAQRYSPTQLKSFCIGLENSPDIKAAEKVAKFIGTKHYSFTYTIEEGIEALSEVIYYIESCDVTSVRASVPMYLLAKKIHSMGIKVILTGEVSDEISGSYAYFKYAPSEEEFHKETVQKLKDLNRYDLLRANKSMMAHSIEPRVPFGDQDVINVIMSLSPKYKMWNDDKIEKTYLRLVFDDKEHPFLPENLLWRKKEQFSDGVGYNWIDELKIYANNEINDTEMENINEIYPINPPKTKEGALYRKFFEKHFPNKDCILTLQYEDSIACSSGNAAKWHNFNFIDPSGRSVKGHIEEYKK